MNAKDVLERLDEIERMLGILIRLHDFRSPVEIDELAAFQAQSELQAQLFTRKEAAFYTRRSEKHFDNTLRPQLTNLGSERRPLYSKKEIDECLNLTPGESERTSAAPTTTSAFRTKGSVTTNRRAHLTLLKLRGSQDDSTEKS